MSDVLSGEGVEWYYEYPAGEQKGPVSQSHLEGLRVSGMVTPDTRVWKTGMLEGRLAPLPE